jgi:hypothetical protein
LICRTVSRPSFCFFALRCCRIVVSISLSVTSTWQIPAAPCAPAAEAPSHTSIEICPKKHVEILSLEIDRIVLIWNLANIHLSKFLGLCVVHHRPCEQFRNCSSKYISIEIQLRSFLLGSSTCKLVSFFRSIVFCSIGSECMLNFAQRISEYGSSVAVLFA